MHIYFSGIGGVAIGPLAEIAKGAGYMVSGSDLEPSRMTEQLIQLGVHVSIGQSGKEITDTHQANPIDWLVISSAVPESHPEVRFAKSHGLTISKRSGLLNKIFQDTGLKLVAVAGTHGKTTTTAMLTWLCMQFGKPVSYSIGTRVPFGPSGAYDKHSRYFVYECDEYDRNMLDFHPALSVITPVDYDHPDIYPTQADYNAAFRQFLGQSQRAVMWRADAERLGVSNRCEVLLDTSDTHITSIRLPGVHYRQNGWAAATAFNLLFPDIALGSATAKLANFPGTERRFERLVPRVYSFYSHHPAEIRADLQQMSELGNNLVAVYQPHQNTRQHELLGQYDDCFADAHKVYWLPTYLSREDKALAILTPEQLIAQLTDPSLAQPAAMDPQLAANLRTDYRNGATIVFMGAGTIDDWARDWAQSLA